MKPTTIRKNNRTFTLEVIAGNEKHAAFFSKNGEFCFIASELEVKKKLPLIARDINTDELFNVDCKTFEVGAKISLTT